jgi:hypothetical protein
MLSDSKKRKLLTKRYMELCEELAMYLSGLRPKKKEYKIGEIVVVVPEEGHTVLNYVKNRKGGRDDDYSKEDDEMSE